MILVAFSLLLLVSLVLLSGWSGPARPPPCAGASLVPSSAGEASVASIHSGSRSGSALFARSGDVGVTHCALQVAGEAG